MKGLITKLFTVFLIYAFSFSISSAATISTTTQIRKPSIVFISPDFAESRFFKTVNIFMQAAADDLGVSLEIIYANDNPTTTIDIGTSVLNRKVRPDYLVMVNELMATPKLMKMANRLGQKTFLFNAPIKDGEFDEYKKTIWLGSLIPDDEQSGYKLAQILVTKAREKNLYGKNGKINIIGVNGDRRSLVPISRERGLKKFVKENDDVKLLHVVNAYWGRERAREVVEKLLKLFPETKVIWSASDYMALGAADAADNMQRSVGEDMLTCGIDWLPLSFDEVKKDRLSCTIGGHIFDGAWLMVLLHDQFNNLYPQFIKERTHFSTVTSKNMSDIENIFKNELWNNIDFRKFSKAYNKNVSVTAFGSHLLINELTNKVLMNNKLVISELTNSTDKKNK